MPFTQATRVALDGIAVRAECLLTSVRLVAAAGGAATAVIHNGKTDDNEIICSLSAVASTSDALYFPRGLHCPNGIYVNVGSNVTEVVITWEFAESP
jgi:hypothetical protein